MYLAGENKTTMPFESVDGRPILKVRVNSGKEPLRFVLDTGSGMSVISEETAKKLGLRPVARGGMARAVGGGGKFEIVYGFLRLAGVGRRAESRACRFTFATSLTTRLRLTVTLVFP